MYSDDWTPEPKDLVIVHGREARIMGVAEGWVLLRHKGCGPFLRTITQIRALPHCKNGVRPKGWGHLIESRDAKLRLGPESDCSK